MPEPAQQTTFQSALADLLREEPQQDKLLNLFDPVAAAVRALHDSGRQHGRLTNDAILVRRSGPQSWTDVSFVGETSDVGRPLTQKERAYDLAQLELPSRLRRTFWHVYFRDISRAGEKMPREFRRAERRYRRRFRLDPRRWNRELDPPLPKTRDLWIWDTRSDQTIGTLLKREKTFQHALNVTTNLKTLYAVPFSLLPALGRYRKLKKTFYAATTTVRDKVGMTIHPTRETAEKEIALVGELGPVPVLLRFYCHQTATEWDFGIGVARTLHAAGHRVSAALVQDRRAVKEPARWRAFAEHVLDGIGDFVEWVEIGHAINRVKWGVWNLWDYNKLTSAIPELRKRYPQAKFMGPAVNDFEFHYLAAALDWLPEGVTFDGVSTHLYVDRRGRPENRQRFLRQYNFAAVDKFGLARALAERAKDCGNKVIVTEVNWFLKDEVGYAHPLAPYAPPMPLAHEWDVSEEVYADYMLRYYLHAICSGMVDLVFWWRLVSTAFGLVDDSDPASWRRRPAFVVLRAFLERFGDAKYVRRIDNGDDETYLFRFERADDEAVIGFHAGGELAVTLPFQYDRAENSAGKAIDRPATLSGRPIYFLDIR